MFLSFVLGSSQTDFTRWAERNNTLRKSVHETWVNNILHINVKCWFCSELWHYLLAKALQRPGKTVLQFLQKHKLIFLPLWPVADRTANFTRVAFAAIRTCEGGQCGFTKVCEFRKSMRRIVFNKKYLKTNVCSHNHLSFRNMGFINIFSYHGNSSISMRTGRKRISVIGFLPLCINAAVKKSSHVT